MIGQDLLHMQAAGPELTLKPVQGPDGTLDLYVLEANGQMCEFLGYSGNGSRPSGPVQDFMPQDGQTIDEWVSYVVRVRAKPSMANYDTETGRVFQKTILQFFASVMEWRLVSISYDRIGEQVYISLTEADEDLVTISSWHWRELCQNNRLGRIPSEGGYWEIDIKDDLIFLSKTMATTLHICDSATVIPYSQYQNLIHKDDRPLMQRALEAARHGQVMAYSRRVLDDGSILHFNSIAIPVYDKEGNCTRILGRVRDITKTEQAVEKLALSENRFRNIVENSSNVFFILDPVGTVVYVSPNVYELLGKPPADVTGRHFSALLDERVDRERVEGRFLEFVRERKKGNAELRVRHESGRTVWLRVGVSPISNHEDNVVEVSAICQDITKEKQQQEELRYMAERDALTGVYNRAFFEAELARIAENAEANVGLIMADLNGLKLINDAFGHKRGDEMLIQAANLIRRTAKNSMVARVGGDEFVVLVRGYTRERVEQLCKYMANCCRQSTICQPEGHTRIPLSVSWGVAYCGKPEENIHTLYEKAEERMYRNKLLEGQSLHSQVITSLKETLKSHNMETAEHMQRMERMMVAIGRRLRLPSGEFDRLVLLASLHDIGKVAIPHGIIAKAGPLTDEEWLIMKTHSEAGSRIAMSSQELSCIASDISAHHERWDGRGYPYGKQGEEIPLLARIVSIVDTYDVMTNRRVYKEPVSHEDALKELRRCSGSQFDPALVRLFIDIFGGGNSIHLDDVVGMHVGSNIG